MHTTEPVAAKVESPAVAPEILAWEQIRAREPRNIVALALHQVMQRIAWVFKTESVVMPAFLDAIAGAGWLRGCLPVLNHLGQSIPPVLLAAPLGRYPQKKWPLFFTTLGMAGPFLILSSIWLSLDQQRQWWLPPVFLGLYAVFFAANGLNQLSFGTLQGKLIRADRRGRVLSTGGIAGSILSILAVWFLMQRWLAHDDGGFGQIFAFAGLGFVASALICLAVSEPVLPSAGPDRGIAHPFRSAWEVFSTDRRFRRLAVVAMLFVTTQTLFPHYQALGRHRPQWNDLDMMVWVIAQNAAVGVFAVLAGIVADRLGNRLVVRLEVFSVACTPLLALILVSGPFRTGVDLFWLTFCLLGMTPVTFRTLANYALELAHHSDHPRYLSTLRLCMAVPFLFSPLIGLLVDLIGFHTVFIGISALALLGGALTFRMAEPRFEVAP